MTGQLSQETVAIPDTIEVYNLCVLVSGPSTLLKPSSSGTSSEARAAEPFSWLAMSPMVYIPLIWAPPSIQRWRKNHEARCQIQHRRFYINMSA